MDIMYKSTRNADTRLTASQAILKGLADDGGLFVPEFIPKLEKDLNELVGKDYKEIAYIVLRMFLSDYTDEELRQCINAAYDEKFDTSEIVSFKEASGAYFMELFHGKTIAFKDMALSILPHLLTTAARKQGAKGKTVILTATSGDTGKAALAGFADVPDTEIIVFYPKDGVSAIQEKQMVTQVGKNVHVVAIKGNFDDAQNGVKALFEDTELKEAMAKENLRFSSANSINVGRLVPQVVYYVFAYLKMVENGRIKCGDKVNFVVPTGNFGNILAAYYAKQMGIPVNKLICASNENNVLYDFFTTGTYDKNRKFVLTVSPSMDILISSNLERLIYDICGENADTDRKYMSLLKKDGKYSITPEMKEKLKTFATGYSSEKETLDAISSLYEETGYVIDTHTAVAYAVYNEYKKETEDKTLTVIASTASPYKFARSVVGAIEKAELEAKGINRNDSAETDVTDLYTGLDDFAFTDKLANISKVKIPNAVEEIRNAKILHSLVCDKNEMKKTVENILFVR